MKRGYCSILVVIASFLLGGMTADARNFFFQHINSLSGLPHQQVEAIAQDGEGYMWFGTRNGLARYDGADMKTFYHASNNPHSLGHNFVKGLLFDSKHRLWICTSKCISRYRPASNDFVNYENVGQTNHIVETSNGKIVSTGDFVWMYDDEKDCFRKLPSSGEGYNLYLTAGKNGNVFVATNQSVYYYDSSFKHIRHLPKSCYNDFLTGADGICPLFVDTRGRLWVGRNGKGVEVIDLKSFKKTVYPASKIANGTVRVIKEDRYRNIWLGTEKGVSIIRTNGDIENIGHNFLDSRLLSGMAIYDIYFDTDDNIWISNYFGGVDLMLHNQEVFRWISPGYDNEKLTGSVARMMAEVGSGIIWIATEDGGLDIYNSLSGTVTPFHKIPNIGSNVHSLYYDSTSGDIWIGTFRNSLFKYNVKSGNSHYYEIIPGLRSASVFSFAKQRNGRLWAATTQGLRYYDAQNNVFRKLGNGIVDNNFVYTLSVDQDDNIWAGTAAHGLFLVNGKTLKVKQWRQDTTSNGLKDDYITSIYVAPNNIVWIGTNNNGLQILNPLTGKFGRIGDDPILNNGTICSILDDKRGNIWITTSQGLFRYTCSTHGIKRFTINDGLPTNQFNFSSSLLTHNGEIYLGTVDGVVHFYPNRVYAYKGSLTVVLKQLVINGKTMDAGMEDSPLQDELNNTNRIDLSYEEGRSFAIDYGVIIPANNLSVNYQMWVEGIDKKWQNVGQQDRFAAYNLSPGTYVLHLRANDTNEGWDKCPEKVLKIVVHPPFYRTNLAYFIYFFVIFGIVLYIHQLYKRRMEAHNQVRIATMEKNKLEELNKAKSDFFTNVSHELKTPLALVEAPLKSINCDSIPEEDRKHLELAIRNTKKIEDMISQLVSFNKVESDNISFYLQKDAPIRFIHRIIESFKDLAHEKHIELKESLEDNDKIVWFSPYYVERIINNLLTNAFKYTRPNGEVNVIAAIRKRAEDDFNYLYFEVNDNGIGIRKEEQEKIFNRFYQTQRGVTSGSHGWGLGLSLVKRLVDIHKGFIKLDSEVNKGSSFKIWLNVDSRAFDDQVLISDEKTLTSVDDYDIPQVETSTMPEPSQEVGNENQMSLLIVEDNDDLRVYLSTYLSQHFHVFTAKNGREGLEVARKEDVILIISDVMMPEMDGIEMCKQLKNNVETSHIPIILLTAKGRREDILDGYKSGAEAYVQKPFDPQALELQVNNIVRLVKTRQKNLLNATDNQGGNVAHLSELDQEFIKHVSSFIDDNIGNNKLCVADITTEMNVSRSLLHIKMKNLLDMSISEFITHKRIKYACRLLNEGYNITETAYKVGFSDPNYFSKKFKKEMDTSPSDYVKSLRQT